MSGTTAPQQGESYSWLLPTPKKVIIRSTSSLIYLIPANPSVIYFTVTAEGGDRGTMVQVNNYPTWIPKTELEVYNG